MEDQQSGLGGGAEGRMRAAGEGRVQLEAHLPQRGAWNLCLVRWRWEDHDL